MAQRQSGFEQSEPTRSRRATITEALNSSRVFTTIFSPIDPLLAICTLTMSSPSRQTLVVVRVLMSFEAVWIVTHDPADTVAAAIKANAGPAHFSDAYGSS